MVRCRCAALAMPMDRLEVVGAGGSRRRRRRVRRRRPQAACEGLLPRAFGYRLWQSRDGADLIDAALTRGCASGSAEASVSASCSMDAASDVRSCASTGPAHVEPGSRSESGPDGHLDTLAMTAPNSRRATGWEVVAPVARLVRRAAAAGSGASTVSPARRSRGDQSASSGRLSAATMAPPAQYVAVSEALSASCPRSGAEGIRTAERARLVSETTVARWSVGTRLFR